MKTKKITKSLNIAIIVISVLVIIVGGFNLFTVLTGKDVSSAEKDDSIKNEYYIVGRAPTEYQVDNFKKLTEELNKSTRDDAMISELVVRAFIIDFFTWSNKKGAWDIGGQQYIYNYGLFTTQATHDYYAYIDVFIEKYGSENLPEVINITTSTPTASEEIVDEKTYQGYYIEATWEYKENDVLDASKFQTQAYFKVIILEDGKHEIVWFFDQW
jgi:hypothetical protein